MIEAQAAPRYPPADSALEGLVHFSRLLGSDESLVLGGGGNTSVKARSRDVAGREIDVLFIKGSGSELKSSQARDYAPMRLADLLTLETWNELTDEAMVEYLARCKLDPAAPRPSIETLLHAFLPATAVFHSHADAILMLTNTRRSGQLVKEVFGDAAALVPYQRPGFALSKEVAAAVRAAPRARGVFLLNHGLVTWGDSAEEAHRTHLELVAQATRYVQGVRKSQVFVGDSGFQLAAEERRNRAAQVAPVLRGALSTRQRVIVVFDDAEATSAFVDSSAARRAAQAGAATPDHILTTKNLPLWLDLPAELTGDVISLAVQQQLADYEQKYHAYFERWKTDEPQLEPHPRVIPVPGIGLFTAGADLKAAQLARDIYRHTMRIIDGAESVDSYASLNEPEAFRAEYWPLELFKLSLAPAPRELAGRVALVTGAGSGLGRAIAAQLAAAGAHVVITDVAESLAQETAQAIAAQRERAPTIVAKLDVTDERGVVHAFQEASRAFGGVDIVVSNAGYAHCAAIEQLELADWERSFAVNSTGHFLVTRAALAHFRRQKIGGNIVFVATKNVTAPGAEFAAYSAAKAAEAQLARVAAIEGGPLGVRVNMVNPDAIFAGTHLWDDIRERRAKAHGISVQELETHYQKRSLLGLEVRAQDVAEAVLFLASDRSSRTTGCMIPVDAGLREAFPR